MTSFLQSDPWIDFQKSLGRKTFAYEQEGILARIIKHDLAFKKSYLYIPHGPAMNLNEMDHGMKNSVQKFIAGLTTLARDENAIFVKIEPLIDAVPEMLVPLGFKRSTKTVQPHRSVVVDLSKATDDLMDVMHHKTRYNIRVAEREYVVVEQSSETSVFLNLIKMTAARDRFHTHPEWYYHRLLANTELSTKLWIAWHQGKAVAGAITLTYGGTAYYLHGASNYEYRALMGPHLLHWRIMNEMKKEGVRWYDFWGIDAQKWPGVTRFKLGWGGRTIEYPGAFDLVISKPWYTAYELLTRFRTLIR